MQQGYTSLNYSHVARHLQRIGTNVFAQLVAPGTGEAARHVSLSSNTDVTLDIMAYVACLPVSGKPVVVAGEINANLPYMPGEAEIDRATSSTSRSSRTACRTISSRRPKSPYRSPTMPWHCARRH